MWEHVKLGLLLGAVVAVFIVPFVLIGALSENGLPTAQELCRGHHGVQQVSHDESLLSESTTALCRDGHTGEVKVE